MAKKKYFVVYLHVVMENLAEVDVESALEGNEDYSTVEELIENEGSDALSGWSLDPVKHLVELVDGVQVIETDTKPEYVFGNDDLNDDDEVTYEDGFDAEFCECEIPSEGAYTLEKLNVVNGFVIEVDADEEFDISKLSIVNGGDTIIYDGIENDSPYSEGDYSEDFLYVNGELIEE